MTKDNLRSRRHEELIHRVTECFGAGVGHSLDHDLIELCLEDVLAHAAVKERWFIDRGPHLLDKLSKKCLADEIGEGFVQLGRVVGAAGGGESGGRGSGVGSRESGGTSRGRTEILDPRHLTPEALRSTNC